MNGEDKRAYVMRKTEADANMVKSGISALATDLINLVIVKGIRDEDVARYCGYAEVIDNAVSALFGIVNDMREGLKETSDGFAECR